MSASGTYLGMNLQVEDLDIENGEYFRYCAAHEFRLQKCVACGLLRYPPGTACPWCSGAEFEWTAVEARGEVHSYGEVHHAIQPSFRAHTPYLILLVDLDTQKGQPSPDESLRVVANLVTADGQLAPPEVVRNVGIGSRVRMVFVDAGENIAVPQWTLDESAVQPAKPWRYPQE
jgi:uncharacterized OB-fold protein